MTAQQKLDRYGIPLPTNSEIQARRNAEAECRAKAARQALEWHAEADRCFALGDDAWGERARRYAEHDERVAAGVQTMPG